MSKPLPSPAVSHFVDMCNRNQAGSCEWYKSGYHVFAITWPTDANELIDLLNGIPIENLQICSTAIADRHFSRFNNTRMWRSLDLSNMPIDGSGLDLLPVCESVVNVDIGICALDGRKMIGLRRFPNVVKVRLDCRIETDEAIRFMEPLHKLETLSVLLPCDDMTGDGLVGLSAKQHLKSLEFWENSISRGFEHLAACPSLERIVLDNTNVDDHAMSQIANIKSLKALYVGSDKITDEGLLHLAGHPNLETLGYHGKGPIASHLDITEECFVHLPKIPNLKSLEVACHVTSKGIAYLKQIPKLDYLGLNWPTLTQPEVDEIRKQLPNCCVAPIFLSDSILEEVSNED